MIVDKMGTWNVSRIWHFTFYGDRAHTTI